MFKLFQIIFLLFFWGGAIASQKTNGYSVKRITTEELEQKIGSYALNGGWCVIPSIAMQLRGMPECHLFMEATCNLDKIKGKNKKEACYFILHDAKLKNNKIPVIYDILEVIASTPYSTNSDVECYSSEISDAYITSVGIWHWRKKNEGIGYGGYLKIKSAWAVDKNNKKFIELDPKKTGCEMNEDTD